MCLIQIFGLIFGGWNVNQETKEEDFYPKMLMIQCQEKIMRRLLKINFEITLKLKSLVHRLQFIHLMALDMLISLLKIKNHINS